MIARPRSPARTAALLVALSGVGANALLAQTAPPSPSAPPRPNPPQTERPDSPVLSQAEGPAFSGRNFGGLRLGMSVQRGELTFGASRASSWTQQPEPGPQPGQTLGGPTLRLVLEGDARLTLGTRTLSAARAVVWLERLDPAASGPGLYQVAAYLDRAGDAGAESGVGVFGDRVLVTALVLGEPSLNADLVKPRDPEAPSDDLLAEAEARLGRYLAKLDAGPSAPPEAPFAPSLRTGITLDSAPWTPSEGRPFEPASPLNNPKLRASTPSAIELATAAAAGQRGVASTPGSSRESRQARFSTGALFTSRGQVSLSAGQIDLIQGQSPDSEHVITATGRVALQYTDASRDRALQLTAERAVMFLEPGPIGDLARQPAERVRGIYLEGDVVATDGRYTLRGPRVFYDVKANQALMIDAVFWTYDEATGLPLYVRADQIRQTANNQFNAKNVKISTSSFFEPQLSLAAQDVTITRMPSPAPGVPEETRIVAGGITARADGLPFFWLPSFEGNLDRFPLQSLSFDGSGAAGVGLRSRFDAFGLMGLDAPRSYTAELLVDAHVRRGFAFGPDVKWNVPRSGGSPGAFGRAFGYVVPNDRGDDTTPSGKDIARTGDVRGTAWAEHIWELSTTWTAVFQGTYISDANFMDSYDRAAAETRREFESSAYLRRIDDNTQFDVLLKGSANNFIANQALLQSQGYSVNKLPEARYFRVSDDLFPGAFPGALTWSQSYRLGYMGLEFSETQASRLGFDTPLLAREALGLTPGQSPADRLKALGFRESPVVRADTRQQLDAQYDLGPVRLNPYVAGRFTAYDETFQSIDPRNDERYRAWYGGGLRASTSVTRVYDDAQSELLDINRLRHIITPSVTVASSGANRASSLLPVYDQDVEGLTEGTTARFGIEQTLQTYRGGKGKERSVDLLKLNVEVVGSTQDVDKSSPFYRFIDFQPERSQLGNFQTTDAVWQVTDATALTVNNIYDIDQHQNQRTSLGAIVQHSADFSTYVEMRYLNPRDATYVTGGLETRLTSTYTIGVLGTLDTNRGELQSLGMQIRREMPALIAIISLGYDSIRSQLGAGITLRPLEVDRRATQLQRINPTQLDTGLSEPPAPLTLPGGL